MSKTYRIKISKGDFCFEAEGDKPFVLDMLKKYGNDGSVEIASKPHGRKKIQEDEEEPNPLGKNKSLSVGEFIRQIEKKKHTDLVLAFGYYLEKHTGKDNFTPADLNDSYYEAKIEPSNTSQMIIQNIKRGYLMAAKGKGAEGKAGKQKYTLTQSGENHIEKLLKQQSQK